MNLNIELLIRQDFDKFIKLVELGIIDNETACDAVIESKNSEYIYVLARDGKNINIKKLEDAIIQIGNAKYIYYFARNVQGANIEN